MALAQSLLPPLAALMLAPLNPPNDPHNPSFVPQSPGGCPSIRDSNPFASLGVCVFAFSATGSAHPSRDAQISATWLSDYSFA